MFTVFMWNIKKIKSKKKMISLDAKKIDILIIKIKKADNMIENNIN